MKDSNLQSPFGAITRSGNIIRGKDFRFSLLTTRLIRMEYREEGIFEDRETLLASNRDFPDSDYTWEIRENTLRIETPHLTLYYGGGSFSEHSLHIELKAHCHVHGSRWYFGQDLSTLKGTCRTLDEADGAVPLGEGLASRDGYSYLDDSNTPVFEGGTPVPRNNPSGVDGYFFGYAHDFFALSEDFFRLSGFPPRLPRYALGNWWSRYWPYTQEEYLTLMDRFHEEGLPFSICVIDMDWHIVEVEERYGGGWTGYTWNEELFPDPEEFLKDLHDKHCKVTLNLHPASGVRAFEKPYGAMAEALGIDPEKGLTIPLRLESEEFMDAYFRFLHHPLEEQGVDFWWIDWQQGSVSAQKGMDPLWLLNHRHIEDMRKRGKAPLILSRYAGPGSHRYPVGFSGDTIISWESLEFQIYFTSTAANIGYNWWSHDIGGHMFGRRDRELSVRWLQFGVFSPINRLHSSRSIFNVKEPWEFPEKERAIMSRYLRLRHRLIPYLYSQNARLADGGRPFLTPLYYHHPEAEESYGCPQQYYFGDKLMVRALTSPMDKDIGRSEADLWLPGGTWFDFFTGRRYEGEGRRLLYRGLENQLVLARGGAVIPLDGDSGESNDPSSPRLIEWLIFAGGDGDFEMVESTGKDDAVTKLTNLLGSEGRIILNPVRGAQTAAPNGRAMLFRIRGIEKPEGVTLSESSGKTALPFDYDEKTASALFRLPDYDSGRKYEIAVEASPYENSRRLEEIYELLMESEMEYGEKERIYRLCLSGASGPELIVRLIAMKLSPPLFGALCELIEFP